MMPHVAMAVLSLLLLELSEGPSSKGIWDGLVKTKLSSIDLPPDILGEGWIPSEGIRIDDFEKLGRLAPEKQKVAAELKKQMTPHGIIAAADYSLTKPTIPLNMVTVRVFIFENQEKCRAWWRKKYEFEGWDEYYRKVESKAYVAVDSLQMNKRGLAFSNVWITTHQLGESKAHIIAAQHIITQLSAEEHSDRRRMAGERGQND